MDEKPVEGTNPNQIAQNEISSMIQPASNLDRPQKSNKIPLILLVVSFLTSASAIGALICQNQKLKREIARAKITPAPAPAVVSPSPTPTTDPTADWKTYTFPPLQLTLKVPPELIVHTEEPNPGNNFTAYIQNYAFNSPYPKDNAYQLYITWQKSPVVTQIEFQSLKTNLDTSTIEDIAIAGYPAVSGQVRGERNRFVTYILKGNTQISLFTSDPTLANKKLTDQILSTFKFLD